MTTTPQQFEDLVGRMRQAQRDYFRQRSTAHLANAKHLENLVDRHLADRRSPTLFDKDPTPCD